MPISARRIAATLALTISVVSAGACSPSIPAPETIADSPAPLAAKLPDAVDLPAAWAAPAEWEPVEPVALAGPLPIERGVRSNTLLVVESLPLTVSFWVRKWELGDTDWCEARSDSTAVRLPWLMGCVSELDVVVPDAVACVGALAQPTADQLAGAILGNQRLGAIDLGPVEGSPVLPPRLFRAPMTGRVVVVPGTVRRFERRDDPDRCVIAHGDDPIEVRGDLDSLLILLDVGGRLAIIRLASRGANAETGAAARARGYGPPAPDERSGQVELYRGMLGAIRDITFEAPGP